VVDLRVRLGRLELKNPVLVASGTFGYVRETEAFVRIERLGGVIPKTVTFHPRAGKQPPQTTKPSLANAHAFRHD
jgi:dihydroorotate dehydrogenase (NAD+) catalytic subunit